MQPLNSMVSVNGLNPSNIRISHKNNPPVDNPLSAIYSPRRAAYYLPRPTTT